MDVKGNQMIVRTLRTYFNDALLGYYPDYEISSFFNILTEHVLRMKRSEVAMNLYKVVPGKKYDKFEKAITQLKAYQPIQYIIGETEFYGLRLMVDGSVLIPRPETEELVDWIIKGRSDHGTPINILDIGTGSGCIAIALAKHLPHANVYALEVCKEALRTAKKNAKLNDAEVAIVKGDILNDDLSFDADLKFDIIVSNPPYVRETEKDKMSANVLDHEPHLALFVQDSDPLIFYQRIARFAQRTLNQNGCLYFEINEDLGKDVDALLHTIGYTSVQLKQDINQKDRMVKAQKHE